MMGPTRGDIRPRAEDFIMARLRHFAVCVNDLDKAAKFYETVFDLKRIAREDLDIGSAVYMSDGMINLALLNFKGSEGSDLKNPKGFVGAHHFGFQVDDLAETQKRIEAARREILLRSRRRAPRQLRAQVQGPRRRHLRYFQARLAGHGQLQQEVARCGRLVRHTASFSRRIERPSFAKVRSLG